MFSSGSIAWKIAKDVLEPPLAEDALTVYAQGLALGSRAAFSMPFSLAHTAVWQSYFTVYSV